MAFKSILEYMIFADRVTTKSRYRYAIDDEEFLSDVEEAGLRRIVNLPANTMLYRAQLAHRTERELIGDDDVFLVTDCPSAPSRMKPERTSAREGRVNPKGIPCLYLADNHKTAMSEVRPWLGAYVSIGHFKTVKDLKLHGLYRS